MNEQGSGVKVSSVMNEPGRGAWRAWRALTYGDLPLRRVLLGEFAAVFLSGIGGGLGLFLRRLAYRPLFASVGRRTVFGRNLTVRHPGKIRIGDNAVFDDNAMIDAKGDSNRGIEIGDGVYVGRHTNIYCKNGAIRIGNRVNISAFCTVMSANDVAIGDGTVVGAYTYLLSGGEYDYRSPVPFAEQTGMDSRGPLSVGRNCWIGARVTVLDAASIGDGCVIGAGSVVTRPVPANSLAYGTPAKVVRSLA